MTYTVRPVSDRTNFTGKHRRSQFGTAWPETERLLLAEVRHLSGRDLVVEVDVREGDIRNDGRIRAAARPETPGVRVAFESRHGPLVYATDRFNHWQDNVRAVALGLEALRKVDRYGITERGEQYAGWKALPAGRAMPASHMTTTEAHSVITKVVGAFDRSEGRERIRRARAMSHPDRHHGDRTLWDQVEQAAAVLGLL